MCWPSFKPTKIAIEADPDNKTIPAAFQDYLAGKHELSQNEIEQIGFRLAKQLGQKQLYPVDVEGEFPLQRVLNYAKAKDRSQELEQIMGSSGQSASEEEAYVKSHTVLQSLLHMNSPSSVAAENDFYMQVASFGEDGDYAGPDLLADWYTRNIRIHSNILKLITSPSDRILVDLRRRSPGLAAGEREDGLPSLPANSGRTSFRISEHGGEYIFLKCDTSPSSVAVRRVVTWRTICFA